MSGPSIPFVEVEAYADHLRREKSPEARIALAVAALLSLEPEDKRMLMDWCGMYSPGILSWRTAA